MIEGQISYKLNKQISLQIKDMLWNKLTWSHLRSQLRNQLYSQLWNQLK